MNKKRKAIIENNKISELLTLKLGGYSQKILIEGKSDALPIVITLHGGPGTPVPFSVGCRGLFPEFTDKFIMVYWDQLGCGINNYKIDSSFKIGNFVDMTSDLVEYIKNRFPNNKLLIFSTSWGSVLSALVSDSRPNDIDGVVASGQIIKNVFFNDEVMNALESSAAPKKKLEIIKNASSEKVNPRVLQTINSCLTKYTEAYNNKQCKKAPLGSMIFGLMTSPDYSFADFRAVVDNGYRNNVSLWEEILKIDLSSVLTSVKIPYHIIQGETDIVASTKTVIEVVDGSDNKNLTYDVVKNTGHFPGVEMMDMIFKSLCEFS